MSNCLIVKMSEMCGGNDVQKTTVAVLTQDDSWSRFQQSESQRLKNEGWTVKLLDLQLNARNEQTKVTRQYTLQWVPKW